MFALTRLTHFLLTELCVLFASHTHAALILVTKGNDSGPGSLTAAIIQSNNLLDFDQIETRM